jgi:uncharacterized membrane protein YqhA
VEHPAEPSDRSQGRAGQRERPPLAPLAAVVGHTRYVVLIAVAAVLLVSITHFVLGAVMAASGIWHSLQAVASGQVAGSQPGQGPEAASQSLTVEFLEIVSVMLKAVVFYLIGTAFYSLFIAPLNLPAALGMETFADLEAKVVSVVIVILAVTFLERFVLWQDPAGTLMMGGALALVVLALVAFQALAHRAAEVERARGGRPARARRDLFIGGREHADLDGQDAPAPPPPAAPRGPAGRA